MIISLRRADGHLDNARAGGFDDDQLIKCCPAHGPNRLRQWGRPSGGIGSSALAPAAVIKVALGMLCHSIWSAWKIFDQSRRKADFKANA